MSVLRGLDGSPHLVEIADRLGRVTVAIAGARGGGAGVLWAPGLVVTNAHLVRGARVRVGLADGRSVDADLVVADRGADLALLRIPCCGTPRADLADSDALRVGAVVVALGHPLGLQRALTAGVVHALTTSPGGRRWIHAAVRLAPGNSGGPLADTAGHVVGINTMLAGGVAMAIPSNEVRRFVGSTLEGAG